ncbi:SDR family oxidoreductase [Streptomyces sp. HC44]|uniref:SDR family oxidoreductase n=1 Tax=Streptomyces scabichelini TaxID=2711217 RepID=A0A6G4VAA2_9ACTN|nr:SDR family oxidoreductase [Streptomyces scabichelini]
MSGSTPRVAIVTGGSRGIGREVATRLAADGLAVVVGYVGNKEMAEETVATAVRAGARAIAVQADVADEDAVAAMFDTAEQEFGGVDVVAHVAGKMVLKPVVDFDLAVLDDMHRTNIRGTFVVAQQAARRLRAGGALITFSSSMVVQATSTYGPYAASKGAVDALTMILARELRGRDVTVNAVAPGPTVTDLFLEGRDQATIDRLASLAPLERLGTTADMGSVVSFLAGEEGRWINGQVVWVNGGAI